MAERAHETSQKTNSGVLGRAESHRATPLHAREDVAFVESSTGEDSKQEVALHRMREESKGVTSSSSISKPVPPVNFLDSEESAKNKSEPIEIKSPSLAWRAFQITIKTGDFLFSLSLKAAKGVVVFLFAQSSAPDSIDDPAFSSVPDSERGRPHPSTPKEANRNNRTIN